MASGHSDYSTLITTTLQHHGTKIFDAVTGNDALLFMLKKRGNIKVVAGGRVFTHPLFYEANSSFNSYAKLDPITTPQTDGLTRAEYPIKIIAGSIALSEVEEAMNAGNREQLLNLVAEKKQEAILSMQKVMGEQVWKDGTVGNDFDGLQAVIPDTQDTALGGITPSAANSYWRSYTYTTSVTTFNTSNYGLTRMNTALNETTKGRQGPRAIFTTKTVYGLYEIGLTANIRYLKTELADSGFRHLAYATMPVLFDDNCPTSNHHMYFVDTDSLWLQVLARMNMKIRPFEYSHDQLSRISLIALAGNLTCGSKRTQGVITNFDGT